jgi:hypothetical protein
MSVLNAQETVYAAVPAHISAHLQLDVMRVQTYMQDRGCKESL